MRHHGDALIEWEDGPMQETIRNAAQREKGPEAETWMLG